ncbi:MAG: hypothetical protein M3130_00480 [Actinomycetota bacterium]|nr:hypothetical protein [Actinomycetota bacterium]
MARRTALMVTAAAAIALTPLIVSVGSAPAATPSSQTVTVPTTAGVTKTITWQGTIPPGANPTSDCNGGTSPADVANINIVVPAGTYSHLSATFAFSISWTPNTTADTSDEILTVVRQGGAPDSEVGSSDTSQTTEKVTASDLVGATYQAQACGFVNAAPQQYTGKLVITTKAGGGETSLPSAPANGLAFSPSVAADPQRDEAEPLITSAPDGRTYTCGPTGFTSASDYAQVSTDGGNQFHLIGTPPRGQQSLGGGGDCAIAAAPDKNATGNYQYAYAGLGPLTGFATTTSADNAHTLFSAGPQGNGTQTTGVLADRQWVTFVDKDSALLSYNQQQPRNIVVQRSDNGGLVYGPVTAVGGASPDFPGPMRTLPAKFNPTPNGPRVVYFGWSAGSNMNLSVSYDGGANFVDCVAAIDSRQPRAGFVTADADSQGNIYLAYADKVDFHTYLVTLPISKLKNCNQPIATNNNPLTAKAPKNDPQTVGFSKPLQVDRDAIRTTVFPWVAAGGAPGHVAVTFYGTDTQGDPNLGSFKGSWNVYVNQSVNALSPTRTFSQVKATTHPMHYDSICLNGLGCSLTQPNGDRSLADFFAIETNPASHRLQVVYNNDAKLPSDSFGHVASPMVFTQIGGPSNAGGTVSGGNSPVVRNASVDPKGDALADYSNLVVPPTPTNEPASDFTSMSIGKDIRGTGGFTIRMKLADLSVTAQTKALADTRSRSLLYTLRFVNGFQPVSATARYNPASTPQWTFKFNDYDTLSSECSAPPSTSDDKCLAFGRIGQPLKGSVDRATGTITITVPAKYSTGYRLLTALAGSQGAGQRPHLVPAVTGSRFYDASAFSFGDPSASDTVSKTPQSYLYTLDNTPAMDFIKP